MCTLHPLSQMIFRVISHLHDINYQAGQSMTTPSLGSIWWPQPPPGSDTYSASLVTNSTKAKHTATAAHKHAASKAHKWEVIRSTTARLSCLSMCRCCWLWCCRCQPWTQSQYHPRVRHAEKHGTSMRLAWGIGKNGEATVFVGLGCGLVASH